MAEYYPQWGVTRFKQNLITLNKGITFISARFIRQQGQAAKSTEVISGKVTSEKVEDSSTLSAAIRRRKR